jgi:hypothetical protein
MTVRKDITLKFVCAMRSEDELELEKDRIHISARQEKIFLQEVMIVLQPDF